MSETVTLDKTQFDDLMNRVAKIEKADDPSANIVRHCNTCGDIITDDKLSKCPKHPGDKVNSVSVDRTGRQTLVAQS